MVGNILLFPDGRVGNPISISGKWIGRKGDPAGLMPGMEILPSHFFTRNPKGSDVADAWLWHISHCAIKRTL